MSSMSSIATGSHWEVVDVVAHLHGTQLRLQLQGSMKLDHFQQSNHYVCLGYEVKACTDKAIGVTVLGWLNFWMPHGYHARAYIRKHLSAPIMAVLLGKTTWVVMRQETKIQSYQCVSKPIFAIYNQTDCFIFVAANQLTRFWRRITVLRKFLHFTRDPRHQPEQEFRWGQRRVA